MLSAEAFRVTSTEVSMCAGGSCSGLRPSGGQPGETRAAFLPPILGVSGTNQRDSSLFPVVELDNEPERVKDTAGRLGRSLAGGPASRHHPGGCPFAARRLGIPQLVQTE